MGLGAVSVPSISRARRAKSPGRWKTPKPRRSLPGATSPRKSKRPLRALESLISARLCRRHHSRRRGKSRRTDRLRPTALAVDESLTDDDLAAVLYTAGASGFPRGAELTHGAFSTHARELGRLAAHPRDRPLLLRAALCHRLRPDAGCAFAAAPRRAPRYSFALSSGRYAAPSAGRADDGARRQSRGLCHHGGFPVRRQSTT